MPVGYFVEFEIIIYKCRIILCIRLLILALFVDWKVYDRNRHFRLVYSLKKSDPLRKLIPLPEESHLPFDISKTSDVLSFSFVSKPFYSKIFIIRSPNHCKKNFKQANTIVIAEKI